MIDATEVHAALRRVSWVTRVCLVDEIGSTNHEALRLAADGTPEGTVVVAGRQTAGRGRLGRVWWSEGGSLAASWVVRPRFGVEVWPLISLAAGLAVAAALDDLTGIGVGLKWPNDLLAGGRKLGGILAEARPPDAVVVGLGVNLSGAIPDDLETVAVSVAGAGGTVPPRGELLAATLASFASEIEDVGGIPERYRRRCATLGRRVRVSLPGDAVVDGTAQDIDEAGSLQVATREGVVTVTSGDVVHVRDAG